MNTFLTPKGQYGFNSLGQSPADMKSFGSRRFLPALILSSWTLSHLNMRSCNVSDMIDNKFVFEFIALVMVIMLVHSTCQKGIHVRAWLALRVVHESTAFKGMRESVHCFASQAFSLSS